MLILATVAVLLLLAAYALRNAGGITLRDARGFASRFDGETYRVQPAHAHPGAAADALARLNALNIGLLAWLKRTRPDDPATRNLLRRYSPDSLVENSPLDPARDTAYALDKGATLAVCLRDRGGAHRVIEDDLLAFVMLHEMAHVATNEEGHTREFWRVFRFLLIEAERAGLYASPDFAASPRTYCGVPVSYNPRFDPTLI